ncbi:MAG: transglutaminase family protein [Betaproteobacteria bacterium]|nr:transglutaminase family protein [Betaproteobacteria bacterium]
MTIRVAIHHVTHYTFDRPVSLSPHEIRLRPAAHARTPVESYSLKITPSKHFLNWQQDPYGNWLARAVFPDKTTELKIEVDLVADMTVINPFDFFVEKIAETYPFDYPGDTRKELAPYLETETPGPLLAAWLEKARKDILPNIPGTVNLLVALNQQLQQDIRYLIRMEPGVQAPEVTLQSGQGSCRDSGWLLVQILRHLGVAARFASGYLIQLVADEKPLDGPAGTAVDFTDLHAWAEAYVPGAGWIGLDPTSGLLTGEGHIPLACAAVPTSAAPVIGMTDVCQSTLQFDMKVTRIHEDPRVTKPYTDAQWADIDALGERIDKDLAKEKAKLTMGGEPTFVSVDDMDGPEWNFTALSPKKLELATELLHRLRPQFAPGSLVHFGQGKWYPGEPLPRWALSCWWRPDGEAVWADESLVAWTAPETAPPPDLSRIFAMDVARRLGLHADYVQPAFENPWRLIRDEAMLPVNVDPLTANIRDSAERRQLADQLAGKIGEPVGHVLPIKSVARAKASASTTWASSLWPLRAGHIFLVEGTSPMGLRLPLSSLPVVAPADEDLHPPVDPFEEKEMLGKRSKTSPPADARKPARKSPKVGESARELVKTAACFEVRDDCLHVFMPPLPTLEDYLRLLHAIEDTARELKQPVRIEGYAPPDDARIRKFAITPDPGVIEVNIHPAKTWRELVDNTTTLYAAARATRLGTEKFQLDGRHTGTGGGNHVTVGGATPAESPLLRRPDLLRSLITYWQNHPALSYLFSGMFIGPTSQSPRVDEARDDNLYELEIAFEQLEEQFGGLIKSGKENDRPWLVDRLLRNFLIDLTGNTHRAEFSIDKLYSPDGPTGRLGLLEFRAFEMPPHARMSATQMLLLRALILRFWKQPYRARLVNWGTELHDRFMLPYFVAADMKAVVEDLQHAGFDFKYEWFLPFIEFRFPRYGTVAYQGIELELRQAIEPWHVLGEEMAGTSTARYVDSSIERMQVKVMGMIGLRHAVACNGRLVPMAPTGVPGEFVAGVRYRAWAPPSALHPTIGVHSPLSFDVVDTWTGRSIGGCTYHVAHPGGRNYGTFPVNAFEAEARRVARFQKMGHTPGPMKVQPEARNPAFPFTLDLRKRADSPLG